jgi:cobalt-zinc-cadmium resistance protein CzcA
MVQCNVRGRDMGSVVADIQRIVDEKMDFPPGYYIEFGGQFENQQRAMRRLSMIVPVTIILIFIMLYSTFGSFRTASLIIITLPLALIGGIISLWLSGQYLSVPASVGFIALFGIAVQDGIVLVNHIRIFREKGNDVKDAIISGAQKKLRPVLMTSLTTMLGLLPLLVSTGIGAEVQRPLATVVIGGLFTSTLLTLLVLPTLYSLFEQKDLIENGEM